MSTERERMPGKRIIVLATVAMMMILPISVIDTDSSAGYVTWTTGQLAGYYQTNTPIDDNDVYETLLYKTYFSGSVFGQSMNSVGSDIFRNISEEYGLTTEVKEDSILDGSIANISGTTKAIRTLKNAGPLFTSDSPYSGDLIQRINSYFGDLAANTEVTVYDEFNNKLSSTTTTTFNKAMNGYVYKEIKTTYRTDDSCRLDINASGKNVSFYSTVKTVYEVTVRYAYSEEISAAKEAPQKCNMTVSVNFTSFEANVYGNIEGSKYTASVDRNKYIGIETGTFNDVSVVVQPDVSPYINTSTAKIADEQTIAYFGTTLGCTVSTYYKYVRDKIDTALDLHPSEGGLDIGALLSSNEFKIVLLVIVIALVILAIYYVLFYVKHRWF